MHIVMTSKICFLKKAPWHDEFPISIEAFWRDFIADIITVRKSAMGWWQKSLHLGPSASGTKSSIRTIGCPTEFLTPLQISVKAGNITPPTMRVTVPSHKADFRSMGTKTNTAPKVAPAAKRDNSVA
jgi:hypothetical protein